MNGQDLIRIWIRKNLAVMGKGSRKELADFLGLTSLQISRMLNTGSEKETRIIKADELEKIKMFFGETSSIFEQDIESHKNGKLALARLEKFIDILEQSSPEQQEALFTFLEIWNRKQRK